MMYAITILGEPGLYDSLPPERQDEVMAGHRALQDKLRERGVFVSFRLMPPSAAVTVNPAAQPGADPLIVDGPFAETKESFLGLYAAEFRDMDEALEFARLISSPIARLEVRPIAWAGGAVSSD